jgi:hypothetical protein
MAVETGNYIDDLVITNPLSSDLVSEGDNQLRLIKTFVKQSFPSVDAPVHAIHTGSTTPATAITEGLIWIDTSAGAGNHIIKVYDGATFLTLPFSVEAAKTVDVDGGTIDGTIIGGTTPAAVTTTSLVATTADIDGGTIDASVIGGTTPAAVSTTSLVATTADIDGGTVDGTTIGVTAHTSVKGTTLEGTTSLQLATGATVTGIDDGDVATGSAVLLATQNAVKTYVDSAVTASDLDFEGDGGTTGSVDLDSQTLDIAGGASITTTASGQTLTVAADDATTAAKGVASFSSAHFSVASGAVSIATDGIDDTLIDFGTGANQVSTADVPEQTNLYYTDVRADGRIAAADIGDLADVVITGIADDEILRYDVGSGTWKNELSVTPDQLSVRGDLLAYNGSAGETRYAMPGSPVSDSNGKVLTADSTATNGFEWQDLVDNSAAMALALGG